MCALTSLWTIRSDVVFGASPVVMFGVAVDRLADMEIAIVTAAVFCSDFIVNAAYVVRVLAGMWSGAIIGGASGICPEVNASGLAAMKSLPLEESSFCFRASLSC